MPGEHEGHRLGLAGSQSQFLAQRTDQLGVERRILIPTRFAGVAQHCERHRAEVGKFVQWFGLAPLVGESDFPDTDVAPGAGRIINDFQMRRFPRIGGHIEVLQRHSILILAGGCKHRLAINHQRKTQLGIGLRLAAADPECDEITVDDEFAAAEFAGRAVFGLDGIAGGGGMGIYHARCVAAHAALVGWNGAFLDWPLAEGGASRRPPDICFMVPIFKNKIGACGLGGCKIIFGRADQSRCAVRFHDPVFQNTTMAAVIETHAVLEFAGQSSRHRCGRRVVQGELKDRCRQAGVIRIQGDERRERFHFDGERHGGVGVVHFRNGIFAAKTDLGKTVAIERNHFVAEL